MQTYVLKVNSFYKYDKCIPSSLENCKNITYNFFMNNERIYIMNLGTRLKKLRTQKGLSQRELAKIIGCSHQVIAVYEKSKNIKSIEVFQQLSDFFNVSIDYLINDIVTTEELTDKEKEILSRYRLTSDYYKSIIDHILEIEAD